MASNYVVTTSRFNPLTFDELLKPALMATQAHNEVLNSYDKLSEDANVINKLIRPDEVKSRSQYDNYYNDLQNAVNELSKNGLNTSTRKSLNDLKSRYKSEITSLENAYNTRLKDIERQKALVEKDNSILFDREANVTSLDDYLDNPSLGYNYISGKQLRDDAAKIASQLADKILRNPGEYKSILGGQYYQRDITKGVLLNDILSVMNGNENAPEELKKIVESITNTSGISNWKDGINKTRAKTYADYWIKQGLYAALGNTLQETLQNRGYEDEYTRWKHQKEMNQDDTPDNPDNPPVEEGQHDYFRYLDSTVDINEPERIKEINKTLKSINNILNNYDDIVSSLEGNENSLHHSDYEKIHPLTSEYLRLKRDYNIDSKEDLQKLITTLQQERLDSIDLTKPMLFLTNDNSNLNNFIHNNLTSSLPDDGRARTKSINQRISLYSNGKSIDEEEFNTVLNGDMTLRIIPSKGDVIINSKKTNKNYTVNSSLIFGNIYIDNNGRLQNGNDFLKEIQSIAVGTKEQDGLSKEQRTIIVNNMANELFAALTNQINSEVPVATFSSSKASTF